MKQYQKMNPRRLCILAGILLLAAAIVMTLLWQWNIHTARKQSLEYVQTLRTLIPEPQSAVPEARRDNTMSAFSLEGKDFIGILEFPRHGSQLPVGGEWGDPSRYPRRFSGSIYDSTLQIGGTSQAGQYEFCGDICVGDWVYFTDMEGNRYTLTVTDLRYEDHADQTALQRHSVPLTLFIKNVYAFDYLMVFCDVPN